MKVTKICTSLMLPALGMTVAIPTCGAKTSAKVSAKKDKRPNFIIIMADDLGYGDIECFGNKDIKTPVLNRMASEGIRLTNYHSNGAVSTPTRAALMTGRYQQRAGLEGVLTTADKNRNGGLQPEEVTFAKVLEANGYNTAIFGKWHLGYLPKYNPATVHGFGEFNGFLAGNVDYKAFLDSEGRHDWWRNASPEEVTGYLTDVITDRGIDFIKRNAGEPFCLYLAHGCSHDPYQGPDDPPVRKLGVAKTGEVPGKPRQQCYREMIERMDFDIGRVFEVIKEKGLEQNTLVLFISDNGPTGPGSAGILRGHKGEVFEGGHRVPGIIWMPGKVEAGSESDQTVLGMDIFPSMLDMAGIKYDGGKKPLDGVSFVPVMEGKPMPQRAVFWRAGSGKAVREGDWKYVEIKKGGAEKYLFNLREDPSEKNNLLAENPAKVEDLARKLAAWEKSVDSETPEQTK